MVVSFIFLAETRFCPERSGEVASFWLVCAKAVTLDASAVSIVFWCCAVAGAAVATPPTRVSRLSALGRIEGVCFIRSKRYAEMFFPPAAFYDFFGGMICSFCVRISLRFVASFQRTAANVGVFSVIMMF